MLFKKKSFKRCHISPHYFWLIKTRKYGIINVSGERGKLKKIVGNRATIIFDKYGEQTVPSSLVVL